MDKRKLIKKLKKNHQLKRATPTYITNMEHYRDEYREYPEIKYLINNVLAADKLLTAGRLPQDLPKMILPDNIQDQIYQKINSKYEMDDPKGDQEWNQLSADLPALDKQLRDFRDYLENQFGMWAYISSSFTYHLAQYLNGHPTLEVMAGNGYISKGLRDNHADVIATDSLEWKNENETGRHPVTNVEQLSALDAFHKYQDQIDYVIMSWSPDGVPIDDELLQAIRKAPRDIKLIVIGEKDGATDSKAFWQDVHLYDDEGIKNLNQHYSNFDLIQDHVYLAK
ncbi:hypothetical protein [Fructilactobacillus fructivorans]|uniref:SAM-dependent methyltransferase n=2 Tax=Fructilactobacillus fructivorans TaxID=1614 RepID=A0AAE6TWS5_9LACO|nr:hypothetical protein [Fructilactobacillus fructivorans]KRK57474.1 hypothetical protein FC73_GL001020 [Fructilactobacillus fructivorans]QFX93151.1 SAM-dependent methyltransferase [Fructilactobacillus fructivorans]RDV64767.1 SAM-dependent methyltransferase [Fructilactobacillus fructivorans]